MHLHTGWQHLLRPIKNSLENSFFSPVSLMLIKAYSGSYYRKRFFDTSMSAGKLEQWFSFF
jgi:hypothetical protein